MRIKEGYKLHRIADSAVVISEDRMDCENLMTVGGCGTDAWEILEQGTDFETLVQKMLAIYDVEESLLRRDLQDFTEKLKKAGVLDE